MNNLIKNVIFIFLFALIATSAHAANKTYNFDVMFKTVHFAGRNKPAISINNQVPGPTIRVKEGDWLTINVTNHLDKETAIHWHGLIVPWQMDGVLGVNQQGIQPGHTFKYHFKVRQSGTYWYHAHAGLQEQQGLYGAIVINPKVKLPFRYNRDYVMVLSDWSNTHPDQIQANLKKEGDYYSPNFPLQPSLVKFISDYHKASLKERNMLINDYFKMQKMRMGIYDLGDVAYDSFLLNGKPNQSPWSKPVKIGDTVRLRFIGAGASTIFHVKIPGAKMKMVHIQGNDVKPYDVDDFSIAPGETYDVLVKIKKDKPYVIYAESMDRVGAAIGVLKTNKNQIINIGMIPNFPEPKPVTREMMKFMMAPKISGMLPTMKHSKHSDHQRTLNLKSKIKSKPMNHDMKKMNHSMSAEPTRIGDSIAPPDAHYATTSNTKYNKVKARYKTNNPNKPIAGVINMELFGYMDRYIWFVNGVPEYNAKPIVLDPGKRYRFVFKNKSMMHHPMHIHGHWFIMRKGFNKYDPLLHTIDVPPGATITADLDTDASGQWFFHCHMLYHMMSGMARVFQYSTVFNLTKINSKPAHISHQTAYKNRPIVREDRTMPIVPSLIKHPMAHHLPMWKASEIEVGFDPFNNKQAISYNGLYGSDYNKLQLYINDAEINKGVVENADIDVFYWRVLSQFWTVKGGVNYFYRPSTTPYWQPGIGLEGLLPFFINTNLRAYYHRGSIKLDADITRDTQISNNFFIELGIRSILATKIITQDKIGAGLNQMQYSIMPYYRITPGISIFGEYEYDHNYGSYRRIQSNNGESISESALFFGLKMLF